MDNSLYDLYKEHHGKASDKWNAYFDVYSEVLSGLRDKPVRMLEIGVQNGGSLDIWAKFFPKAETIVGCDINPACGTLGYSDPRIKVIVADAGTELAFSQIQACSSEFDLIIDDGSHRSSDIVKGFAKYFPLLADGGVYVAEDLHCSYWQNYQGGLYYPYSSMAFFKRLADVVNAQHWSSGANLSQHVNEILKRFGAEILPSFLTRVHSVSFHNSMCVIRANSEQNNRLGKRVIVGEEFSVYAGIEVLSGSECAGEDQSSNPWIHPEDSDAELGDINKKITQLIENNATKDKIYMDLQVLLKDRDSYMMSLFSSIDSKEKKIDVLQAELKEALERVAKLNEEVYSEKADKVQVEQLRVQSEQRWKAYFSSQKKIFNQIYENISSLALKQKNSETTEINHRAHVVHLEQVVEKKDFEIAALKNDIALIHSSRAWRFIVAVRHPLFWLRGFLPPYAINGPVFNVGRNVLRNLPVSPETKAGIRKRFLYDRRVFQSGVSNTGLNKKLTSESLEISGLPAVWEGAEWPEYFEFKRKTSDYAESIQAGIVNRPVDLVRVKDSDVQRIVNSISFPIVNEPLVSILIPVYGNTSMTLECLQSICEAKCNVSFEIFIADDASPDDSVVLLGAIKGIRYFRQESNLGFLRNCNSVLEKLNGKYVVYLNNDVQVTDFWLDNLLKVFEEFSDAGAVGSKIIYPSGHLQESGVAFRRDGSADMVGLNDDPVRPMYGYTRPVDYVSGAALLVRFDLLKKIGGFDERFAPAYCEDADLCLSIQELGYKVYCASESVVVHHLSKSMAGVSNAWKLNQVAKNLDALYQKWSSVLYAKTRVRVIAFYLPQFHEIEENNNWWGPGFTEWTNVRKAKPNFEGHYQPRIPADLGYYDLASPDAMQKQVELAQKYGVDGFCFYYYWFDGKRLLEHPIEEMLAKDHPKFPFCLCWANENWTRRWDGRDSEILIGQNHCPDDDTRVIRDLIRYFKSDSYIRIDGKPLVLVYRVDLFPNFSETAKIWRETCRRDGVGEIYISYVESHDLVGKDVHPSTFGCDASVEFPPLNMAEPVTPNGPLLNNKFGGGVANYKDIALRYCRREMPGYKRFRGVMPGWDNTARRQDNGFIFQDPSPGVFQAWLEHVLVQARRHLHGDEKLVFVNAWNEWAEGAYLEPDERFGHGFLEAVRSAKAFEDSARVESYKFGG